MNDDKKNLLQIILNWADAPWKALMLAAVILIGMLAYLGSAYRDQVLELLKTRTLVASVAVDNDVIETIKRETSATLVTVWAVNTQTNTRKMLASDPELTSILGREFLFLEASRDSSALATAMFENRVLCDDISPVNIPADVVPPKLTIVFRCVAAIPPQYGMLVGYISAGFDSLPPVDQLPRIRQQLLLASQKLAR